MGERSETVTKPPLYWFSVLICWCSWRIRILTRRLCLAFQVAVALAEAQGQKDKGRVLIKKEHIKATVDMSKEFSDYLKRVHKSDMSKKAAMMGNRFDAFKSGSG